MNAPRRAKRLAAALAALASALWAAPDFSLALEVRMLSRLTSLRRAREGPVRAVVIRPLIRDGQILIPAGSLVFGKLRAKPVGLGLIRERAIVDVEFNEWQTPAGDRVPLDATLQSLDNAREQLDRRGRIQGILAASNPLSVVRGFWFRPHPNLFLRAPAGLTGASGFTWARMSLGPIGAAGLFAVRCSLTRLPEPEIDLPPGAEITLRLNSFADTRTWGVPQPPLQLSSALTQFLLDQPIQVMKSDSVEASDIVNIVVTGPGSLVRRAFAAAGWVEADALTRKSFAQTYNAFTRRQGYAAAPVSGLTYRGRLPELVFQKSLNSIAKRHHIRLWHAGELDGQEVWLGAATHDVTVTFNRKTFGLTHKVDSNLDRERDKVWNDLSFAGVSEGVANLDRAALSVPAGIQTDGRLSVIPLRLDPPEISGGSSIVDAEPPAKRRSVGRRLARRVILETRHYLLRENVYYLAFRAVRGVRERRLVAAGLRKAPSAPAMALRIAPNAKSEPLPGQGPDGY